MVLTQGKQTRQIIVEVQTETPGVSKHGFFSLFSKKKIVRTVEGDVLATVDNDEIARLIDLAFKSEDGWASNGFILVRVLNRVILSEQDLLDRERL